MADRHTLIDFFRDIVNERGEFLAYDDGFRRRAYSYTNVGCAARGFAARLAAAGIGKDDKVIFWAENRPEWIACYWGCLLIGAIAVPIDYRSSPDFVAKVRGLLAELGLYEGGVARVWRLLGLPAPSGAA